MAGGSRSSDMLFQDIRDGKYRVIITSPEQIMKPGGGFEKLMKNPSFRAKIISFVFDEAHCISQWGVFREEYREVGRLRGQYSGIPFTFASATFSAAVLADILAKFGFSKNEIVHIRRPNDRPNLIIGVRQIKHALNTYQDLAFLIPDGWKEGDPVPPKFLIFFDKKPDAVSAAKYLRKRLPYHLRHKIPWFHSDMTSDFRDEHVERLRKGEIWGLCATDSFGMVYDLFHVLFEYQSC